jgi:hypothetical protein
LRWNSRGPHVRSMRAATMPASIIDARISGEWHAGPSVATTLVPAGGSACVACMVLARPPAEAVRCTAPCRAHCLDGQVHVCVRDGQGVGLHVGCVGRYRQVVSLMLLHCNFHSAAQQGQRFLPLHRAPRYGFMAKSRIGTHACHAFCLHVQFARAHSAVERVRTDFL